MHIQDRHIDYLFAAELQFRLASTVRLALNCDRQPLDLPQEWVHGQHRVAYDEIALRKDQADVAGCLIHQSATLAMAVAIKDSLEALVPELTKAVRKADPDAAVRNTIAVAKNKSWHTTDDNVSCAYHIARLITNAYSHAPFAQHLGQENILPNIQEALGRAAELAGSFEGIGKEVAEQYRTHAPL